MIAASRPVNKNVSTGAVIRAKCGTEPGVHKLLANCQTAGTTFIPVQTTPTLRVTMQSVTGRQTDRIHDVVNSR